MSHFESRQSLRSFRFGLPVVAVLFGIAISSVLTGCQSSSMKDPSGKSLESAATAGLTPGTKLFSRRNLEGSAYTVDGTSTTAQAIVLDGESRRPLFLGADVLAFAKRRSELDRWQVFEADLSKETERRISFDAGDAEPVTKIGSRLVIATSSEMLKSSERVLTDYKLRFRSKESKGRSEASESESKSESKLATAQHLLIEKPAVGRQGTEWVQMSREPSEFWKLSFDRELKTGIALLFSEPMAKQPTATVFRISVSGSGVGAKNKSEIRTWQPLRLKASDSVVDGHILPDGRRIVWSDGTRLWTTTVQGADPQRVGDDSLPGTRQLTVDPSGRWIVFSTPSGSRGMNLMVVNLNGKCARTLTELPGDELEPAFSNDGRTIVFSHQHNGVSAIAKVPFGTPEAIAGTCS